VQARPWLPLVKSQVQAQHQAVPAKKTLPGSVMPPGGFHG